MTATDPKTTAQNCCVPGADSAQHEKAVKTFTPRADVYETKDAVELFADMPGVDEKSLDITLDKNVLTIRGNTETSAPAGFTSAHVEYAEGHYERSFKLADEIDRESIKASIKNGILRVTLNKAAPPQARKIEVKVN